MSDDDDAVAEALSHVVFLGDEPTPQELELGEVVAEHITNRQPPCHPATPDPEVLRLLRERRTT